MTALDLSDDRDPAELELVKKLSATLDPKTSITVKPNHKTIHRLDHQMSIMGDSAEAELSQEIKN